MHRISLVLLALLLIGSPTGPAYSQDQGRVAPSSLPLPLPGATPIPLSHLRADNPWNLPMTGAWRFRLTHGQIINRRFVPAQSLLEGISASSSQSGHAPGDAFDGSLDTRWCAADGTFPQWLQVDLGKQQTVTGVTLNWEQPQGHYQCRIEGGMDSRSWTALADETTSPGIGDGLVSTTPRAVRFLRILVTGSSSGWASLDDVAIHISQNGQDVVWRPQPNPSILAHVNDFTQPGYDDHGWNTIPVPANWEMLGYSLPTYNAVDDTVGLYRRWVFVPKTYAGRRIYWNFDGVLDGAEVFVNGRPAGYHESGYTAFDVDLTGLVQPGRRNLFAVRVCKTTPSVDCDTGDFQSLGGIYRDTSLIAVPQTHIHDLTVTTPLSHHYRDATLHAQVLVSGTPGSAVGLAGAVYTTNGQKLPVRLSGSGRLGPDGQETVSLNAFVRAPRLWSAETPDLYFLVLQLTRNGKPVERVEQRFGFREVQIVNNIVLWNGRPIKCTGVCRHDFWANKGFALTDKQWVKDLDLMKAANINAIRTSHYNPAARFLELCDEKGFYVLDEVPFCWIGRKVNDPSFAPPLLQRAAETVARDKNRPCVLAWSLGNENGVGQDSQTVLSLVNRLDPTRPAFISQAGRWGNLKGQAFADRHYPSPSDIDNYLAHDSGTLPAIFTEQPHTYWQKADQDYDPGVSDLWSEALIRTWQKIWPAPTILGSFIWEWQNQGIADKNADKTTDFWYGPHHLRQENNKGIVDSFRHPKAEYWIVKMVYSPVVIGGRTVAPQGGVCTVLLRNRYTFTDLRTLTCRWTDLHGDSVLRSGIERIACAPGGSVRHSFPAPARMTALRLEFDRPDGTSVTIARLGVLGAPVPAPPPGPAAGGPLTAQETPDGITVRNTVEQVVFSKRTGSIQSWRVGGWNLLAGSPILNLGQGKTGTWKGYFAFSQPPILENPSITTQPLPNGGIRIASNGTVVEGAGGQTLGTLTCLYDLSPDARIHVSWTLHWTAQDTKLWEAGLLLPLSPNDTQMRWWRDSYFTDYPAGHLGEPLGSCRAGDVLFRASKRGLHWMTLTDGQGAGLELLNDGTPLVGRAQADSQAVTLFASSQVAGPQVLSGDWVADHDIVAAAGKPLSGSFILRPVVPAGHSARLTLARRIGCRAPARRGFVTRMRSAGDRAPA